MNKAVMISIQPKFCDLIASGRKTIEVRKTISKIPIPFKCYIYHNVTRNAGVGFNHWCDCWQLPNGDFVNAGGKVVGEFVCDRIDKYKYTYTDGLDIDDDELLETMLDREEINIYANGKDIYGLHISNLVIYDKPKDLGEFRKPCDYGYQCKHCDKAIYKTTYLDATTQSSGFIPCNRTITHPFQSWGYVEEM